MLSVIETVNDVTMFSRLISSMAIAIFLAGQALAVELIMVEQKGCSHCQAWHKAIGPIYPKTPEGAFAPLSVVNISEGAPDGVLTRGHAEKGLRRDPRSDAVPTVAKGQTGGVGADPSKTWIGQGRVLYHH